MTKRCKKYVRTMFLSGQILTTAYKYKCRIYVMLIPAGTLSSKKKEDLYK